MFLGIVRVASGSPGDRVVVGVRGWRHDVRGMVSGASVPAVAHSTDVELVLRNGRAYRARVKARRRRARECRQPTRPPRVRFPRTPAPPHARTPRPTCLAYPLRPYIISSSNCMTVTFDSSHSEHTSNASNMG